MSNGGAYTRSVDRPDSLEARESIEPSALTLGALSLSLLASVYGVLAGLSLDIEAAPFLVGAGAVGALLFGSALVGFTKAVFRPRRAILVGLAVVAVLLGFASLSVVLLPVHLVAALLLALGALRAPT